MKFRLLRAASAKGPTAPTTLKNLSLVTIDGKVVQVSVEKIVGIYPNRLGSIVAIQAENNDDWSEIIVGHESGELASRWNEARSYPFTAT
ncbi:MAG: hypothetical protein H0T47_22505 [Planctomycetaceae bacterium]|nr:hypothetical protein [Planctomycetaceae bacterium]